MSLLSLFLIKNINRLHRLMNIGHSLIQVITVNSNIYPSQIVLKRAWGSWDQLCSWREGSYLGCMHANSWRCPFYRMCFLRREMLILEWQPLRSCESTQPRESKVKAAKHTHTDEIWNFQKCNIITQKNKVLAPRTKDN